MCTHTPGCHLKAICSPLSRYCHCSDSIFHIPYSIFPFHTCAKIGRIAAPNIGSESTDDIRLPKCVCRKRGVQIENAISDIAVRAIVCVVFKLPVAERQTPKKCVCVCVRVRRSKRKTVVD